MTQQLCDYPINIQPISKEDGGAFWCNIEIYQAVWLMEKR